MSLAVQMAARIAAVLTACNEEEMFQQRLGTGSGKRHKLNVNRLGMSGWQGAGERAPDILGESQESIHRRLEVSLWPEILGILGQP